MLTFFFVIKLQKIFQGGSQLVNIIPLTIVTIITVVILPTVLILFIPLSDMKKYIVYV